MEKEESKLNIFEIEHLNLLLDDFDSIFKDKEKELEIVENNNTIHSIKAENIKPLLFAVNSYQNSLIRIKDRFLKFKNSTDCNALNKTNKKLVKTFENKIDGYLERGNNFINRCEEFLYPIDNDSILL